MQITTDASIVVCPFAVAIDQREKAPYSFENMLLPLSLRRRGKRLVVECKKMYLPTGDYSVVGFEDRIAVERKSLADLYSTLGQHRERFEAEVERLANMEFAAIVVEAGWPEIIRPAEAAQRAGQDWRSRLNPLSVWGTIWSWSQRYPNVHWFTVESRRLAELATFEILKRWREENHENE